MNDKDRQAKGGTNARPLGESIAGTAPGIPDEARGPGKEFPQPPSDDEVAEAARRLKRSGEEGEQPERSSGSEGSAEARLPKGNTGSASGLQPGGTTPGGDPETSTGSIGTGGGSTAGQAPATARPLRLKSRRQAPLARNSKQ